MNIADFTELSYEKVQQRAKELGYSKAVATRAYNLARLAMRRSAIREGIPQVKGIGGRTLEFIDAL